jgi:hypothetical protein
MIADDLAGFERGRRTGLDIAANIAASMGYFAVARAIRAGGNDTLLEALLRERSRTVVAESALMAGAFCAILVERRRQDMLFPGEQLIDGTGATEPLRELASAIRRAGDELNHTEKNSFRARADRGGARGVCGNRARAAALRSRAGRRGGGEVD